MPTGVIKTFNEDRGFGFISRDDEEADAFLHVRYLSGAPFIPTVGQHVEFEVVLDAKTRRERADNVRLMK